LGNLSNNGIDGVAIDTKRILPHECLTRELEQNALVSWHENVSRAWTIEEV
jgi:hypothetical protein